MSTIYSGYGRYEEFTTIEGQGSEFGADYDDFEYRPLPPRANARVRNVGDKERWASVIGGVGLLALATRQRRLTALVTGAMGTYLIARGIAGHCHAYRALSVSTRAKNTKVALSGPRGVHVHKTMTINQPVDVIYNFWRDLSNLPKVMRHLESVAPLGSGRSHWVAKGPAGMRVEWDAEIIHEEENRVIAWRSLEHADVVSAGSVNFRGAPNGGTEIRVKLQYDPPAGRVGALIAKLFGEEPSQQIEEDLRRLKAMLEASEVPTTEGQPRGGRKASTARRSDDARRADDEDRERADTRVDAQPTPHPGTLTATLEAIAKEHQ